MVACYGSEYTGIMEIAAQTDACWQVYDHNGYNNGWYESRAILCEDASSVHEHLWMSW